MNAHTTLSTERVGLMDAEPFNAALWAFTARMDAATRKEEKTHLKATASAMPLARQIKAASLQPSIYMKSK